MKADYWRQGVATILTAGLLTVGAFAQDGAEGEVNIQDEAPAAVVEVEEEAPTVKPAKPQIVDRDPFVNQLMTGRVISRVAPTRARGGGDDDTSEETFDDNDGGDLDDGGGEEFVEEVVEEVVIPEPDVTVNGIVSSGSGRQAIITTPTQTLLVSHGQKLGDYYVSGIGSDYVTLNYGGQKSFTVNLASEFGGN